jgi:hypothetical protein
MIAKHYRRHKKHRPRLCCWAKVQHGKRGSRPKLREVENEQLIRIRRRVFIAVKRVTKVSKVQRKNGLWYWSGRRFESFRALDIDNAREAFQIY